MARYWQSTTFNGFYVEGYHQDRTIANHLLEVLEGAKISKEIMGAGFYVWLKKGADPALRIKDLSDRTLIELLLPESPAPKKAKSPVVSEGEVEGEVAGAPPEVPEEIPVLPGALEDLYQRVDTALGALYSKVNTTPPELKTKLDLKLTKWRTPKPMAIVSGEPLGGTDDIELETAGIRGGGGGFGGIMVMIVVFVLLAGGVYYMLTTASNDPYYIFSPGAMFDRTESALAFIHADTNELIIISVPTRLDTIWESPARFIREEADTVTAINFIAESIDEFWVEHERRESVILVPADPEQESSASELDVSALQWNRNEEWQQWFDSEINRALVRGTLVRMDDALWLQAGENFIQLELWEYLTEPEMLRLKWAEDYSKDVLLEIQFIESFRYNRERTQFSRKLFRAEVRKAIVL